MVSGVPLPECSASIRESRRETILVRWLVLSCSPPPPDRGGGGASRVVIIVSIIIVVIFLLHFVSEP